MGKIRIGIRCDVRVLDARLGLELGVRLGYCVGLGKIRIGIRCEVWVLCRIRNGLYRMRVVVLN